MKSSIEVNWLDKMSFESEINGHKIVIDAGEESGGENKGMRPKPLMLLALAGCTGMDVVSILKKMRVEFNDFKIRVEGNITEEHPKQYDKMKIIYEFWGKNLSESKLIKAIELSEERYCGVSAVYQKTMDVSWELIINEPVEG